MKIDIEKFNQTMHKKIQEELPMTSAEANTFTEMQVELDVLMKHCGEKVSIEKNFLKNYLKYLKNDAKLEGISLATNLMSDSLIAEDSLQSDTLKED